MGKRKINKTALILEYAAAHPSDKPKAIAAALTEAHSVPFKPQGVSQTLLIARKTGKLREKKTSGLDIAKLLTAAAFVKSMGIENAKAAIDLLAKLHQ